MGVQAVKCCILPFIYARRHPGGAAAAARRGLAQSRSYLREVIVEHREFSSYVRRHHQLYHRASKRVTGLLRGVFLAAARRKKSSAAGTARSSNVASKLRRRRKPRRAI